MNDRWKVEFTTKDGLHVAFDPRAFVLLLAIIAGVAWWMFR